MIFVYSSFTNASEAKKKVNLITNPLAYELVKYNNPAGSKELNLEKISSKFQLNLNAVTSPDFNYMAYTEVYNYPQTNVTLSSVYLIELNDYLPEKERILKASVSDKIQKPIFEPDFTDVKSFLFKTNTIVDWNATSDKILIKEKIGKNLDRIYVTNLYVYDLKLKKIYKVDALRRAIVYYWKKHKNISLDEYKWDIQPLGWDDYSPDRIIVKAFGIYKDQKKFLGTWSCDFEGNLSVLLSLDENKNYEISQNGFYLKK
jgi:hypothetical protein